MLDECVEWTGCKDGAGYGVKWYAGRTHRAHRLAYCVANNVTIESLKGLVVRHKCDNPPCVNPKHLEIGTHADNNKDRASRGRSAKEVPSRRVLSSEEQEQIRKLHVYWGPGGNPKVDKVGSLKWLARKFGVDPKTIKGALHV